jgi:hypothetical protein
MDKGSRSPVVGLRYVDAAWGHLEDPKVGDVHLHGSSSRPSGRFTMREWEWKPGGLEL